MHDSSSQIVLKWPLIIVCWVCKYHIHKFLVPPITLKIHSAKKFLDTCKSPTEMFHIRQIKSISWEAGGCLPHFDTKLVGISWHTVLIIWIKTVWKFKIANVTIHQYTDLLRYHLFCTVEWLHLQFFKTYLSLFKLLDLCYLTTDSFKLGIKMKKTFTCFPWCAFNLPDMKHFSVNWTFRSDQELFLLSVHCS